MAFLVSPGVQVKEIDLTGFVPGIATTTGAVGGVFRWGPVEDRELISSEGELVQIFGKPDSGNFETWFSAANFLSYANALYVSRAASSNTYNAVCYANNDYSASESNIQIKNREQYFTLDDVGDVVANTSVYYAAKWPGELGNELKISVCDSANAYSKVLNLASDTYAANATLSLTVGDLTAQLTADDANTVISITDDLEAGDIVKVGNTTIGYQFLKIKSLADTATTNATVTFDSRYFLAEDVDMTGDLNRYWEYYDFVDKAPGTSAHVEEQGGAGDEIHVVVVDKLGNITGTRGAVLEKFEAISRATDARGTEGGSIYYKDVLNRSSYWIWYLHDRAGAASQLSSAISAATTDRAYTATLSGGTKGASETSISFGSIVNAYDQFKNAEEVDVSLIICGKAQHGNRGTALVKYVVQNICEKRLDCMAFVSPQRVDVVDNTFQAVEDVINTRNQIPSTSYAAMDSGYKYMFDRYNDVFRYVPLNGDIAGLTARTEYLREAWFSPAGYTRGIIKGVSRLAYSPDQADRDELYKAGVNPITFFPGQGHIMFGDKTLLARPSAFDRINVRRLFIVLEKAIATFAKFSLFELNDAITRRNFVNAVEPFLRTVQARRGIYDFKVICDQTNNTPEVIDRNEFIADIYIKPARSINFITLNFVAVRTGVSFSEVIGKF